MKWWREKMKRSSLARAALARAALARARLVYFLHSARWVSVWGTLASEGLTRWASSCASKRGGRLPCLARAGCWCRTMFRNNDLEGCSVAVEEGPGDFPFDDDFTPSSALCCCEIRTKGMKTEKHVIQHCCECSDMDRLVDETCCKCNPQPNDWFYALERRSAIPFPGGARPVSLNLFCLFCFLPIVCFVLYIAQGFFMIQILIFGLVVGICVLPYLNFLSKKAKKPSWFYDKKTVCVMYVICYYFIELFKRRRIHVLGWRLLFLYYCLTYGLYNQNY